MYKLLSLQQQGQTLTEQELLVQVRQRVAVMVIFGTNIVRRACRFLLKMLDNGVR